MAQPSQELLNTLQQLEETLRHHGWWETTPPPPEALESRVPFHADYLELQQWLQWIFLPRIREIVEQGETLPWKSEIAPAAEFFWRKHPDKKRELLPLLTLLDRQLNFYC